MNFSSDASGQLPTYAAISTLGGLDVVATNASDGLKELTDQEVRWNFEVNSFDLLNVLRHAAPAAANSHFAARFAAVVSATNFAAEVQVGYLCHKRRLSC
jgi:NAD(P)-dependent dehydrogenase (short-subunit alcohol dehydrogenase family)